MNGSKSTVFVWYSASTFSQKKFCSFKEHQLKFVVKVSYLVK